MDRHRQCFYKQPPRHFASTPLHKISRLLRSRNGRTRKKKFYPLASKPYRNHVVTDDCLNTIKLLLFLTEDPLIMPNTIFRVSRVRLGPCNIRLIYSLKRSSAFLQHLASRCPPSRLSAWLFSFPLFLYFTHSPSVFSVSPTTFFHFPSHL